MLRYLSLLLPLLLLASPQSDWWNSATKQQRAIVHLAYSIGLPSDYGITLAAITIVESNAGMYRISTNGDDYGVTQVNLHYFLKSRGIVESQWTRSAWATELVRNDILSLTYSLELLLYNRAKYGSYRASINAYNGRCNLVTDDYYNRIKPWVVFLKRIFPKY